MALSFTMKQHDSMPTRTLSLVQTNPADPTTTIPVDLTNASSAKLIAVQPSPGTGTFTSTLTFPTPRTGGTVLWTPIAGNTAVAGAYNAEVEVTWSGGGVETFPNDGYITINIVADLG